MRSSGFIVTLLAAVVLVAGGAQPARAQVLQIDSKDGTANLKIGFLLQSQVESLETANGEETSTNLFLRRFRVLFGGKVSDKWTFFFETDSPNLGKASPAGVKDASFVFIQDAFVTYNHSDALKVDTGMILPALSRNNGQSAATLLGVDYGPYTFVEGGPLGERVGRDYGVQLRGYPFKQKLEYRLAVLQGHRGVDARNALRVTARAVYYPFGAETGFFYAGTFHGKRKAIAIGAAFDHQEDYDALSFDAFVEQPFNGGKQAVTVSAGWKRLDGDGFLTALPRQDTQFLEAALHLAGGKVSPFVQYARRDLDPSALPDQDSIQGGVAWWMAGHNRALKFSVGRQQTDGLPDRTQALVQLQIFYF